jgi:hypothetical protein
MLNCELCLRPACKNVIESCEANSIHSRLPSDEISECSEMFIASNFLKHAAGQINSYIEIM